MKNYNKRQFIYFEVALPVPFFQTFTYKMPKEKYENLDNPDLIGRRVLVPFRKSGYTGIITEIYNENFSEIEDYEIREIEEIPDKNPIFTQKEINIAKILSDYYLSSLGITLYYFMPEGLRWKKKNGKWIKTYPESYVYSIVKFEDERLTKKQKELLEFITSFGEVAEIDIVEAGFTKTTINSLLKKGFIKKEGFIFKFSKDCKIRQKSIEKNIKIKKGIFFYGGENAESRSKKYIKLIENLQKEGKSCLIVFPSIAHIKKSYEILSKEIKNVYIYHDGIDTKENVKTWFILKEKEASVLLTSYSGILTPIKNLSLIIVEEEASDFYKTLRTPKFDVRRAVFEICKEKNTTLIYSGLIPSVENYYSIKKGISKPLGKNYLNINYKAKINIYPFDKDFSIKRLINLVKDNKNTLIIANKKAYASFLYCPRCEDEILCERCDVPLKVYKKNKEYLQCNVCSSKYEIVDKCPECETPLEEIGTGIEKIEEYLRQYYADISYLHEEKSTKIKLTTTIIDKDLTTGEFDRVINIYPDFFLFIQDYKGRERFFRNIIYSYIKAKEKFILFTNQQNDVSLKSILNKNLENFYENELNIRKKLDYPPFKRYILLTFERKKLDISFLNELFQIWIKENNLENMEYKGIFKAYYSKVRGKERAQVLLVNLKNKKALKNLYEKCQKLGIKLIIDVDPIHII